MLLTALTGHRSLPVGGEPGFQRPQEEVFILIVPATSHPVIVTQIRILDSLFQQREHVQSESVGYGVGRACGYVPSFCAQSSERPDY